MAKKQSQLEQMRANPRADWSIKDIERFCRHYGLNIVAPSSGSHYVVSSGTVHGALTVPHNRPIKPIYIKQLVGLSDAHIKHGSMKDKRND
jgi:hypothetical protein